MADDALLTEAGDEFTTESGDSLLLEEHTPAIPAAYRPMLIWWSVPGGE